MPYRIDLAGAGDATMERLVELGALDIERAQSGELAALMPDNVTPDQIARAIATAESLYLLLSHVMTDRSGC